MTVVGQYEYHIQHDKEIFGECTYYDDYGSESSNIVQTLARKDGMSRSFTRLLGKSLSVYLNLNKLSFTGMSFVLCNILFN